MLNWFKRKVLVNAGVQEIKHQKTSKQVEFLSEALRTHKLTTFKLRRTLEESTPDEMHKGADELIKKHKDLTVDNLLADYNSDESFQQLASCVGLHRGYFEALARREINAREESKH